MPSMLEDVAVFDTLTAAKAAVIPAGIQAVQTYAYHNSDDGGGATYRRLTAAPSDPLNRGYFKDAADTWFALTSLDANVKMFGCVGDNVANDQDPFQDALNYAFGVLYTNLYVPAGCYKVNSLMMPGRTGCTQTTPQVIPDDRNKRLKLFGQGVGEGYALQPYAELGGTKIIGGENQIVLDVDDCYPQVASSGMEICDLAFIGTGEENPNPVVRLRITQNSSFHHNIIHQEGIGNGLDIPMIYQADIAWNRISNKFMHLFGPDDHAGTGIRLFNEYSPSQVTIRNNSSRGFTHAGVFGYAALAHAEWQLFVQYNEASCCKHGWTLYRCDGALVMGNYIEGAKGGTGFTDKSHEVSYITNFLFPGFDVGFDFTDPDCRGPKVSNCTIRLGDHVGARGIKLTTDQDYACGYSITDNYFEITANTNDVIGIEIDGTVASVNLSGNAFNPSQGGWWGTNSRRIKINSQHQGLIGMIQHDEPALTPYPGINNGQISFASAGLTASDIAGTVLTIGPKNYFNLASASAANVLSIVREFESDTTQVTFQLANAMVTFKNSSAIKLDGGVDFAGPGAITFAIARIGGADYAYELSRSTYI